MVIDSWTSTNNSTKIVQGDLDTIMNGNSGRNHLKAETVNEPPHQRFTHICDGGTVEISGSDLNNHIFRQVSDQGWGGDIVEGQDPASAEFVETPHPYTSLVVDRERIRAAG